MKETDPKLSEREWDEGKVPWRAHYLGEGGLFLGVSHFDAVLN
jgi:hypothetical protein